MSDLRDSIRHAVYADTLELSKEEWPADDANLFEAGYLDSVTLLQMLVAIQQATGIELPTDDMTEERVGSIDGLTGWAEAVGSDSMGNG